MLRCQVSRGCNDRFMPKSGIYDSLSQHLLPWRNIMTVLFL